MRVDTSVFCGVRDPQATPLCAFYRALVMECLRAFQVPADVAIESCRAVSGTGAACLIRIELVPSKPAALAA
jgi:hypothetical protein